MATQRRLRFVPDPTVIDLNADLGESFGSWSMGDDAALLAVVTSANIACGFHAGDPTTLLRTCRAAAERGVAIGAHVSYHDLAGFGRRFVDVHPDDLAADVLYQIGALDGIARACGTRVSYVKPHGALYNTIAHDRAQAHAVIEALQALGGELPLVVLAGSPLAGWARQAGLTVIEEAFADRGYTPQGTLVSRREPGAVLHDAQAVADRMLQLVTQGTVPAVDDSTVRVRADSICVHGDSPGAVAMARAVRQRLQAAGVAIRPFIAATATPS